MMRHCRWLLLWFVAVYPVWALAQPPAVSAEQPEERALGLHSQYLQESESRLSIVDAAAAFRAGEFRNGETPALTFGIGPKPVWVRFNVFNAADQSLPRRLLIETPWLDDIEVALRHDGHTLETYQAGDHLPFEHRPVADRNFAFDFSIPPGMSAIYLRVQTEDPMVLPIYLLSPEQVQARERIQNYSYGFLYGFLLALLAYNAMLYAGLRHARYLLYALYLGMFILMNLSYTGHGFQWLWPDHTDWAQWSNPLLMYLYGASGLVFATRFLDTRTRFPRIHRFVLAFLASFGLILAATMIFGQQRLALLTAFTFAFLFATLMLAMGVRAVQSGQAPARYFLLAALAAMLGALSTALSTWGFIPFNTWTFRAVDIGMLLDATLLALALTYQFRVGQQQRLRAEELATLDPLTGINNRRAFYAKTASVWSSTRRHDHKLSVILMDIDRFKNINDAFGHAHGDEVLSATAEILKKSVREHDVIARWGGEEFILLLPETALPEAVALAERLRLAIRQMRLRHAGLEVDVTASFGAAQRRHEHATLDALISDADKCLYRAKATGRDRVAHECDDPAPSAALSRVES